LFGLFSLLDWWRHLIRWWQIEWLPARLIVSAILSMENEDLLIGFFAVLYYCIQTSGSRKSRPKCSFKHSQSNVPVRRDLGREMLTLSIVTNVIYEEEYSPYRCPKRDAILYAIDYFIKKNKRKNIHKAANTQYIEKMFASFWWWR